MQEITRFAKISLLVFLHLGSGKRNSFEQGFYHKILDIGQGGNFVSIWNAFIIDIKKFTFCTQKKFQHKSLAF